MTAPVLVLVAGDPVPQVLSERGGFADLIRAAAGSAWEGPWLEVDLRRGALLPGAGSIAAVVITGSASSVTDREPWVMRGEEYLRHLVSCHVPVFGICFGHQMLGQALGGHVARNPRGREIGTVDFVVLAADPILDGAAPPLRANTTHVDTVQRLPSGAIVLARTEREPHAAVRFSERAWGVQFHPEMDAAVVCGYIDSRRDVLRAEGLDPDELIRSADDGTAGKATLTRFLEMTSRGFR